MKRLVLVATLLTLHTSCMLTRAYQKSNEEYRNSRREFDTESHGNFKIFRGTRETSKGTDGTTTIHLQFEGPLKGSGRYLDVVLSSADRPAQTGMMIFESNRKMAGGTAAYLVVQITQPFYTESNQDYIYSVLEQKVGRPSHPRMIVKRHFDFDITDPEAPLGLVILNLSNIYQYSANALVWDAGPDGTPVVSALAIDLDSMDGPRLGIEWKQRSRPIYIVRQGGTIGPVVADVVTAPIQLVILMLMGIGGGGAR